MEEFLRRRVLTPDKIFRFPLLRPEDYKVTSLDDGYYNCASWAIGEGITSERYDPTDNKATWPSTLQRDTKLETFVRLYIEFFGFELCSLGNHEAGFVKLAIYSDKNMQFTHVARQLPSGKWTSKLGDWEDIEHATPECLQSGLYGKVRTFLKKPITK